MGMKLTNKAIKRLENLQRRLKEAERFINRPDIKICSTSLPNNLSYYNKEGEGITPLTKFIGSDLMQLSNAINDLHYILETGEL